MYKRRAAYKGGTYESAKKNWEKGNPTNASEVVTEYNRKLVETLNAFKAKGDTKGKIIWADAIGSTMTISTNRWADAANSDADYDVKIPCFVITGG